MVAHLPGAFPVDLLLLLLPLLPRLCNRVKTGYLDSPGLGDPRSGSVGLE